MIKKKPFVKRVFRFAGQSLFIFLITLLLFEASFRIYLIDFYRGTIEALNSDIEEREGDQSLMIIGDSFSAFKEGYPNVLYDSLTNYNIRNISVAGTSIREQFLFGRHHLKREKPDVLIFQFYVGNDLLGWRHPWNTQNISVVRNIYWRLSEHFWSLAFLNYRLSKLRSDVSNDINNTEWSKTTDYTVDRYDSREKRYLQLEPYLIENSVFLKGGRQDDLTNYMERISSLFKFAKADCEIYLLVIPHAAQVDKLYFNRSIELGARFSDDFEPEIIDYPLYNAMTKFFSQDSRVKIINSIQALRKFEKENDRTYYNNDSHLNWEGQKVIGNYLLDQLKGY